MYMAGIPKHQHRRQKLGLLGPPESPSQLLVTDLEMVSQVSRASKAKENSQISVRNRPCRKGSPESKSSEDSEVKGGDNPKIPCLSLAPRLCIHDGPKNLYL